MKKRLFLFIFFIIISVIPVFDLFSNTGQPTTFDGIIHISTIAQFSSALQSGDFPVVWLNSFANYGLPVGLFSQQLPIYIGALVQFFTHNAVLSYNLVLFLGIFLTNVFFYRFLRLYVGEKAAITGVIFLTLAPMHIIDIYIRGDLPEIFAGLFIPLILLSGYMLIAKKEIKGFFLLLVSIAGITLSHPMMLFVGSFFFIPYFIYLFLSEVHFSLSHIFTNTMLLRIVLISVAGGVGVGIAAYYIMPLFLEIKYFYFGNEVSHFVNNQYLSFNNFLQPQWYYFTQNDIATRGQFILTGLLEILSLPIALVFLFVNRVQKNKSWQFLLFLFTVSCIMLFFTTILSSLFYKHIHIFDSLQFPWRFLAVFLFIPPLVYAIVLDKINKNILIFACIVIICILRFPQLYGKNYVVHPQSTYSASLENLQSVNMNTIWTGPTESYPIRNGQARIISGNGTIREENIKNSSRRYTIDAQTPLRLVDYTFYFPGWKVFIDNTPTAIEFQDPQYRGIVTYSVPEGRHTVDVVFTDTAVRKLAKIISILFFCLAGILFAARNKIRQLIQT